MAASPSDLKTRFPEFDSVDNSVVQTYLDDALLSVNSCVFGNKTDLAQIYLAAHNLAGSGHLGGGGAGSTAGPVIEEEVGDLTRRYQSSSGASATRSGTGLENTRYGQAFLRLRRECVIKPLVIVPTGFTRICD